MRIPLRRKDGSVRAYALVDDVDYRQYGSMSWHLNNYGYVIHSQIIGRAPLRVRSVSLHREILGLEHGDPRQADHINRNPLDNRRANLRIATTKQNGENRPAVAGASSRFRGVTWDKRGRRWQASAAHRYIGTFEDEIEAARAAEAYRAKYMPFAQSDPELAALDLVPAGEA